MGYPRVHVRVPVVSVTPVFSWTVGGDGFVDTSVWFVKLQRDMIVVTGACTELWQGSTSLHASYGLSNLAEVVVILVPSAGRSTAFVSPSVSSRFVEHY